MKEEMEIDLVIKLGGAAISNKNEENISFGDSQPKPNLGVLDLCLQQISVALENKLKVVLVHGAGGYGHHFASKVCSLLVLIPKTLKTFGGKHKVNEGLKSNKSAGQVREKVFGACLTHFGLQTLNNLVIEKLLKKGISSCSIQPFGCWVSKGEEKEFGNRKFLETVERALSVGMLPVVHGDVVFDDEIQFSILSGDVIMKSVAKKFKAKRAVFLTDVEGVFDKPPNEEGSKLLREIKVDSKGTPDFFPVTKCSESKDVTGGMETKVKNAVKIVSEASCTCFIVKAGTTASLQAILGEEVEEGTKFSSC